MIIPGDVYAWSFEGFLASEQILYSLMSDSCVVN